MQLKKCVDGGRCLFCSMMSVCVSVCACSVLDHSDMNCVTVFTNLLNWMLQWCVCVCSHVFAHCVCVCVYICAHASAHSVCMCLCVGVCV